MRRRGKGFARPAVAGCAAAALACLLSLEPASRAAGAQEPSAPCPDASCAGSRARALMDAGEAPGAVEALKRDLLSFPDDPGLRRLLGIAYLKAGNGLWALRTLEALVADRPEDCEARAWLARAHLERASLEGLAAALDAPECRDAGPVSTRLDLLRAQSAGLRGGDAPAALASARRRAAAWPEDRAAMPSLARRAAPDALADLSWRLEVAGGWTSNAWMASVTEDPAIAGRDGGSPFAGVDLLLRATPFTGAVVRPLLEAQARGILFTGGDVRGQSWLDLSGRAGLVFRDALPRITLAYRPDALLLGRGDRYDPGPLWYLVAHRGEFEVEARPWMSVFGGAGRRAFRESARSRVEADLGLAGRAAAGRWITLMWAVSGRAYRAGRPAWNLWGGTALLGLHLRLPRGFSARATGSAGLDTYPDSGGDPNGGIFGTGGDRLDVFGRASLVAFSPAWSGVRVGLAYEFAGRQSNAAPYGYTDHRVGLRLSWSGEAMLVRPAATGPAPRPAWGWGTGDSGGAADERVQDLLRQDEQSQRSSSCVQ
jgi:hypothetical protein